LDSTFRFAMTFHALPIARTEEPMKLYWCPQTRSFRGLWLMEEAGRPYERVLVDINKGDQDKPEFRAINPMGKVPALADGEAKLAESAALCAYVAERVPEAKLAPPLGDPARAHYLHWLFFAAGCIEPAYTQKFTNIALTKRQAGWGSFDLVIDVLEQVVQPGPWVLGERFSAADIMIGADLHFGLTLLKIVPPRPAIAAYVARCAERPAFKRAMAIEAEEAKASAA
jgi:glutathione S-transferase